jgi:hypothetical protein
VVVNEWLGVQIVSKKKKTFFGYSFVPVDAWIGILQDASHNYRALTQWKT